MAPEPRRLFLGNDRSAEWLALAMGKGARRVELQQALREARERGVELFVVEAEAKVALERLTKTLREVCEAPIVLLTDVSSLQGAPPFDVLLPVDVTAAVMRGCCDRVVASWREQLQRRDEANALHSAAHAAHRRAVELSRVLRELCHELSTPIGIVLGSAGNLADGIHGELPADAALAVRRVYHASALLRQLLERARSSLPQGRQPGLQGGRRTSRRQLYLGELAREVAELFVDQCREADVTLEVRDDSGARPLWGERARLQQLLVNLISNALRHVSAGGRVQVHVCEQGSARDGISRIEVSDDGPGVPPELRERIFEAGVTDSSEHQGMGLPICKHVVDEHGGRIHLSRQAGGACFVVDLPVDPRRRTPRVTVQVVDDVALAGQLLAELERCALLERTECSVSELAQALAQQSGVLALLPAAQFLERLLGLKNP